MRNAECLDSRVPPDRKLIQVKLLLVVPCALLMSAVVLAEPFKSTYVRKSGEPTLIRNVTLLTGVSETIDQGYVHFRNGRIVSVGEGEPDGDTLSAANLRVIDGDGHWVTPGIIDVHSHLGNYASPLTPSHSDGNESTSPNTAEVWAEHSVWPQDPQFPLALAGGVTSLHILPGSANLFGGRGVTLKNVSGRNVMEMKFPGAPHGLKMACGENPKRIYGAKKQAPSTRMGNVAGYRQAWAEAESYRQKWKEYEASVERAKNDPDKNPGAKPKRDLKLETLVGVLDGEILVQNHCYRADEMSLMIEVGKEFGYTIAAFHHGVEAYKIADLLRENDICAAIWADWWRFKMESFDGIRENVALVEKAGACAVVHSDDAMGIQHLNQEAAKAMAAGNRMGMDLDESVAITWITKNAAKALGVLDQTGTLEAGKMADVVVWDGNPFSVYTRTEKVFVDGALLFDRSTGIKPVTDFEFGHRREEQ